MTKKLQKNKYRVLLRQGLTTKKLVAINTKSWQVLGQKVGRFDPKKRVPPLIQKFIAGLYPIIQLDLAAYVTGKIGNNLSVFIANY